jgi:hypothetical protein
MRKGENKVVIHSRTHVDLGSHADYAWPTHPSWKQHCTDPTPPGVQQQTPNPDFSNVHKRDNNWNVCFLCGFDIENGHRSIMCPFHKINHQQAYTRKNAQQFIAAGYNPCTKGMHKTILPLGRNT